MMSDKQFILVLVLISSVAGLGVFYGMSAWSFQGTTYTGTVQYASTVDGKTTLIINEHTLICDLTPTASFLGLAPTVSPPTTIASLQAGNTVSLRIDNIGDCAIVG